MDSLKRRATRLVFAFIFMAAARAGAVELKIDSGWQLISVPLKYVQSDTVVQEITGVLTIYSSEAGRIESKSGAKLQAGNGYWLDSVEAKTINITGGQAVGDTTFSAPLNRGWNIIGNPFDYAIDAEASLKVSGVSIASSNKVNPYFFFYDGEKGVYRRARTLEPWKGYFVYAKEAATLEFEPLRYDGPPKAVTVRIVDTQGANGREVTDLTLAPGGFAQLWAAAYDANDDFIGNVDAKWESSAYLPNGPQTGKSIMIAASGAVLSGVVGITYDGLTDSTGALATPEIPDLSVFPVSGAAVVKDEKAQGEYIAGELIAIFEPGATAADVARAARAAGLSLAGASRGAGIYQFILPPGADESAAASALAASKGVKAVTKNYVFSPQMVPNDTIYTAPPVANGAWGFNSMNLKNIWGEFTAKRSPVIAVLDTGVEKTHPELAGRVLDGRNFADASGPDDTTDRNGHGTQVAGVIAAKGNNGIGISGVCWDCKILPVKVCDDGGVCSLMAVVNGIIYAVDRKADVINIGLGGDLELDAAARSLVVSAVQYARSKGAVIVAAAGNSNKNNTNTLSGASPDIISVAAITSDNWRAGYSNYGPMLRLSAPGDRIYTTDINGGYKLGRGTSLSAAFVSGSIGLLLAANDTLTVGEVMTIIDATVVPTPVDQLIGGGLNTGNALMFMKKYFNNSPDIINITATPGASGSFDLRASATDPDGDTVTYEWAAGTGTVADSKAADTTWSPGKKIAGEYTLTLTVSDAFGGFTIKTVKATVTAGTDQAKLALKVVDSESGAPVSGATVHAAGKTLTTDAAGAVTIDAGTSVDTAGTPVEINITKNGYIEKFTTARIYTGSLSNGTQTMTVELYRAALVDASPAARIVHADGSVDDVTPATMGAPTTVTIAADDRSVTFTTPASAGAPAAVGVLIGDPEGTGPTAAAALGVTGRVSGAIVYGDPTSEKDLEMFPGEFLTDSDTGAAAPGAGALITGGFARINLNDSAGNPITQFADGAEPTVTMRVPYGVENPETGKMVSQGDTIPIFFYDETSKEWVVEHETDGSVKRSIVQQDDDGMFVQFKIKHLTWWNLDWKSALCPYGQPKINLYDMFGKSLAGKEVTVYTSVPGWGSYPHQANDGFVEFQRAPADVVWQVWAKSAGETSKVVNIKNCGYETTGQKEFNLQIGECSSGCANDAACNDGNSQTYDVCLRPGACTAACKHTACTPICNSDAACDDGIESTKDTCKNAGVCGAYCSHVKCSIGCANDASCDDADPDTLDVCMLPNTCNATCTHKAVYCDLRLDQVNYFPDDTMEITLTGVNNGDVPVNCGVESALKRDKVPVWNSFYESLYMTIPPGGTLTKIIYKTIPLEWVGTDTNDGSDYDMYTVREDGSRWDGRDNFNIHVHKPCERMCMKDSGCNDNNPATFDVCRLPNTCNAVCEHLTCTVACATAAECNDGNPTTVDSCANPKTCDAECYHGTCAVACDTNAGCNDGNPYTDDACLNPGACNAMCSHSSCNPACTNDTQCDDQQPLTRDTCVKAGACDAFCTNDTCTAACNDDAGCADTNPITIDTCLNPATCDATCTHVNCSITCEKNSDCDDQNALTTDTCNNPGACDSECVSSAACVPQCTTNAECDDGTAMTPLDECYKAGTCDALCRSCTPSCTEDYNCADTNPLTRDICTNRNTCDAACSNTPCTANCVADSDCSDANAATADECLNPNTCDAACVNAIPACNSNADCNDGNSLTTDMCIKPGKATAKCFNVSNQSQISVGHNFTCSIDSGRVKCWGINNHGQIGNGTYINSIFPVYVKGITDAVSITLGRFHTCALLAGGGVKCWGYNIYGQLGNGTTFDSNTPVSVAGITDAIYISAMEYSTCAVLSDGGIKCWGYNGSGQLGNGTTTTSSTPVSVTGITDATSVALEQNNACAVLSGGSVKCWGYNGFGQLGNGTFTTSYIPVSASLVTNVISVAVGENYSCVLLSGGNIKCWGYNYNGQLGNGTTATSYIPFPVLGISDAVSVSARSYSTCAVLSGGNIKCWGYNYNGQLGNGTTIDSSTPVYVSGVTDAISVSLGFTSACAMFSGGGIKCWGYNNYGQLGNGTTVNSPVPVDVIMCYSDTNCNDGDALTIDTCTSPGTTAAACINTPCSVRCSADADCSDGNAATADECLNPNTCDAACVNAVPRCNSNAECDDGSTATTDICVMPGKATAACKNITGLNRSLSKQAGVGCKADSGRLKCWGSNANGQFGNGTTIGSNMPVNIPGLTNVSNISLGAYHTCGILASGELKCWGNNTYGQLGTGTTTTTYTPATISTVGNPIMVVSGSNHTCALMPGGGVKCWGINTVGQLGNGMWVNSSSPVDVLNLTNVVMISAGNDHTCAVLSGGGVKCWGRNDTGSLGNGTTANSNVPVDVTGISNAVAVSTGSVHACALLTGGAVKCWGYGYYGELGNGTTATAYTPVSVSGITNAIQISAGSYHTCATLSGGGVKCWGRNTDGQVGIGTTTDSTVPADVFSISGATSVSAGSNFTCAFLSGGRAKCWGNNTNGQLGNGTTANATTPVDMIACSSNANCDDGDALTIDTCTNPGTGASACVNTPCTVQCSSDAGCNDGNAATTDECLNPNTCDAACVNAVPQCNSNAGCDDGNSQTTDMCFRPGTATAKCANVFVSSKIGASRNSRYACGVVSGKWRCWGQNGNGELGNGTTMGASTPVAIRETQDIISVGVGDYQSCMILASGAIKCWGNNSYGQLGNGTTTNSATPVPVTGITSAKSVSSGAAYACAVVSSGEIKCWGLNGKGQLGNGTTANSSTPVGVYDINDAVSVSAGYEHACAVLSGGAIKCWGDNSYGQLGNGTTTSSSLPVYVSGITNAVSVSTGWYDTCAVLAGGGVKCWGMNASGQLGNGSNTNSSTPVNVSGITNAVSVSVGHYFTCAVLSTGTVKCWGVNSYGQLGNGSTYSSYTPVAVSGINDAVSVSAGTNFTCVFLAGGEIKCWGDNSYGQLGNGTTVSSTTPVDVIGCLSGTTCDDYDPMTVDNCTNPGTAAAACVSTGCTPSCATGADCDDGDAATSDVCYNSGSCYAYCGNVTGSWEELAGSGSGMGISNGYWFGYPAIEMDLSGNPMVVYSGVTIYNGGPIVKKWNGSAWVQMGGDPGTATGISTCTSYCYTPTISTGPTNNPVVAWMDKTSGNWEIYLKRWNGTAWAALGASASGGGISANSGQSSDPAVAIDSSGNPVVFWGDDTTGSTKVYGKRWNGSAWVEMAGSATQSGLGAGGYPSVATDNLGNTFVVWASSSAIVLKKWNGTAWSDLGGSAAADGISGRLISNAYPAVAVDSSGRPVVAWVGYVSGSPSPYQYIYIKRWNGSSWEEIGAGSASGGGISGNTGFSYSPSLTLDLSGNPIVAWVETVNGVGKIYVKRWNGTKWLEAGGGAASGGGITAASGESMSPSIFVDSSGNPAVTWTDRTNNADNIYVKRFRP